MARYFTDKERKILIRWNLDGSMEELEEVQMEGVQSLDLTERFDIGSIAEDEPELPAAPVRRKINRKHTAREDGPSGMTARVLGLVQAKKDTAEIAEELGISSQAVSYHKRKLGITKKNKDHIPGRMRKKDDLSDLADDGLEYYPITDPEDIRKIWDCVDDGLRTAGEIAKRLGFREEATADVLMRPRP